jgi:perosamine synthetase
MGLHCLSRPSWPQAQALIFSLSRGKSLPAAGGGLIGTNWEEFASQCRAVVTMMSASTSTAQRRTAGRAIIESTLSSLCIRPFLYWLPASIPHLKLGASIYDPSFRIGPLAGFQERLATRLLPRLRTLQEVRLQIARRLRDGIASLRAGDQFWVVWPKQEPPLGAAEFLRLPILARQQSQRDRIVSELGRCGLGVSAGYPEALCDLQELRKHLVAQADCPVARQISRQLFTLPTHCWVTNPIQEEILGVLEQCHT